MIKSMTGYGRATGEGTGKTITVEIRSVNQRYYDAACKLPRVYGFLEEEIKKRVQQTISRGKVEIFLTVEFHETANTKVVYNKDNLQAYMSALDEMSKEFPVDTHVGLSELLAMPDIFLVTKEAEDEEQVRREIFSVLEEAIAGYDRFRTFEGKKMDEDIRSRVAAIRTLKGRVEELNPACVVEYREKLREKMTEILAGNLPDENRILQEAALYADKICVDEETVRLGSHLEQLIGLLETDGPVGRKMDFLLQEMNREVNTTGSKVNHAELTDCVVEMKCELEKIREQIQNIE